jgi:hypothetical protein
MDDDMAEDVREAEMKDRIPPKGKVLAVGCRVIQGLYLDYQNFKMYCQFVSSYDFFICFPQGRKGEEG